MPAACLIPDFPQETSSQIVQAGHPWPGVRMRAEKLADIMVLLNTSLTFLFSRFYCFLSILTGKRTDFLLKIVSEEQ